MYVDGEKREKKEERRLMRIFTGKDLLIQHLVESHPKRERFSASSLKGLRQHMWQRSCQILQA
jgi:hypothetical protein